MLLKQQIQHLKVQKKSATFSTHKAGLLPMATYNQSHSLSVFSLPKLQAGLASGLMTV